MDEDERIDMLMEAYIRGDNVSFTKEGIKITFDNSAIPDLIDILKTTPAIKGGDHGKS